VLRNITQRVNDLLVGFCVFLFTFFLLPYNARAQFAGDFGAISGAVKWGTENLNYSPAMLSVQFVGNTTGYTLWKLDAAPNLGSLNTGFILPPDTYTVNVYKYQAYAPNNAGMLYGTQTVTVVATQTTTANFDVSGTTGFVRGSLNINGLASGGYIQFCGPLETDPCTESTNINNPPFNRNNGPWNGFNSSGFSIPIVPGNYRVHVITANRASVEIVPVAVTAGQINNSSTLQFSINLGTVSGTIKWGTQFTDYNPAMFNIKFAGSTTGYVLWKFDSSGSFNTGSTLPPDTYTVSVYRYQIGVTDNAGTFLGSQTISVGSGQVVNTNFDLSGATGLVNGSLLINGVASGGFIQFCGSQLTDPCMIATDINQNPFNVNNGPWNGFSSSGFKIAILPGNYRVRIITANRASVGIIPITVTTGQVNTDPSLQLSIVFGSISGTVRWNTETPNTYFNIRFVGNLPGYSYNLLTTITNGSFNTGFNLPPDTYTVTLYRYQLGLADGLGETLSGQMVSVGPGQNTTLNFDLSGITGLVKGNLTINGSVAGGYIQFCGPQLTSLCTTNTNINQNPFNANNGPWYSFNTIGVNNYFVDQGGFKIAVAPGSYRVHVITLNRAEVGILLITVTQGTVSDLVANAVNVPIGQNVTVTLPGIEVTFSSVTSAGFITTSTSTHPSGGLPPSQYRFLGNYYELTTTASYTGLITVKFTYNDVDVHGQEANLKLFHWNGSIWQNITTSVDTVNNVISGETTTLSPFTIGDLFNSPPTVDAGGPYQVSEGGSMQLTANGSDPENEILSYAWDLDNNGSFESSGRTFNFSALGLDGPSTKTIAVQVTDVGGLTASNQTTIEVINIAPTIEVITAPLDPMAINTTIDASVSYTDPGTLDTFTTVWEWGDGNTSNTGSHTYSSAGVYTLKTTVTDDDGGSTFRAFQYVVVYDPEGGFVTGGGWITSPIGAYTANSTLTSKASFGFVSKYQHGANVPSGQTEFQFKVADFNFKSTAYEWLVVAGSNAKYKGSGTINGTGDYGFMLTAKDGNADSFRIKIWDKTTGNVIYDNQLGTSDDLEATDVIEGGSVVIHN